MGNKITTLEEACTRATIEKQMKLDGLENLFFNGQDYGAGFHDGAMYIIEQIENELNLCAVNRYEFPILHILDFIDKVKGKKKQKDT